MNIMHRPESLMDTDDVRRLLKISAIATGIVTAVWLALYLSTSPAKAGQRSVSLTGVVAPLADKAREIISACGSIIVSAVSRRPNRSNHPIGRAVDIQGNPSCIYAHLKHWPGGYSIDYNTAPGGKHVHISYNPGGQEWGLRFAHRDPFGSAKARRIRLAHAAGRE